MNNIEFKDVAHLYLGCQIYVPKYGIRTVFGVSHEGLSHQNLAKSNTLYYEWEGLAKDCKPILRPLSSMTYDEFKEWAMEPNFTKEYFERAIWEITRSLYGLYSFLAIHGNQKSLLWLYQKGFDLFGLIKSRQAINATTLKLQTA